MRQHRLPPARIAAICTVIAIAAASKGPNAKSPQSEVAGTSYAQQLLRFGAKPLTAAQISTLAKTGSLSLDVSPHISGGQVLALADDAAAELAASLSRLRSYYTEYLMFD